MRIVVDEYPCELRFAFSADNPERAAKQVLAIMKAAEILWPEHKFIWTDLLKAEKLKKFAPPQEPSK